MPGIGSNSAGSSGRSPSRSVSVSPLNRSDEALPPSAEAAGGHLNLIDPEQTTLPVVKVHTRSKLTFRSPLLAMATSSGLVEWGFDFD